MFTSQATTGHNLRDMADMAQRASDRDGRTAYKNADAALREAYAEGVEDVLRYVVGDTPLGAKLANILNADKRG